VWLLYDFSVNNADFLRNIRVRKLLSQQRLADKAGVTRQVIALLEAGKEPPTPRLETIRRVSEALGVDPCEVKEFEAALQEHAQPTTRMRARIPDPWASRGIDILSGAGNPPHGDAS
jgi:transcriptional regulator with XRE-family HTH domain